MRPQKQPLHAKGDFLTSRSKGDTDVDAFIGKQVYLDIKNHKASALIEDVLKRLGAVLHVFLGDEVNLIVTDRKEWIAGSSGINSNSSCQIAPKSTGSLQLSSKTSPTIQPLEAKAEYHVKSRVGEMLNRAKTQSTEETVDPLDLAVRKGITILSLAEAQDLLNKLLGTAFYEVKPLNAPFIKLDFSRGSYLPLFKEFPLGWPAIKINCSGSPFTCSSGSVRGRENKIERNVTQETCLDKSSDHSNLKVLKESSFPLKSCNVKSFNNLGIQTSGNRVNCNVSISSSICDVANVTTSSNQLYIGDPSILISPKGTTGFESTARVSVSETSDSNIQILSKCNASVILTEELKYDTVLSMPVRPNISGKLLLFLPKLGSSKVIGEIHIVLNDSDPVVSSRVALTKQVKFHSVPVYHSNEYDIFARTGGTSIWISNNKSSRGNKHLSSLTNSSDNHSNFHRVRHVENLDLVSKEKESAHESTIHSVTVSIISGSSDLLPGNRVLMQISLPNSSSAHCLEITVITASIKCFYYENNINVNVPLIDIGLLEILLCHLVSSVTQKEIEEWCNSRESKNIQYTSESFLKKKSNSIIFELVFPEPTEIDTALSTLLAQGIDELLMKGEYAIKAQNEYQGKFNFNYLVRYFTNYTDCKKEFIQRGKSFIKPKANSFKEIVSQSVQSRTASESVLSSAPQGSLRSPSLVNGNLHKVKKLKYFKFNVQCSKKECSLETKVGRKQVTSSNAKVIGNDFYVRSKSSAKKRGDSNAVRRLQEGASVTESDVYSNVVSGFCQICSCNYSCLTKHLKEQQHIDFVKNSVNFMELDQSIFEVNRSSIFGQRQVSDQ